MFRCSLIWYSNIIPLLEGWVAPLLEGTRNDMPPLQELFATSSTAELHLARHADSALQQLSGIRSAGPALPFISLMAASRQPTVGQSVGGAWCMAVSVAAGSPGHAAAAAGCPGAPIDGGSP